MFHNPKRNGFIGDYRFGTGLDYYNSKGDIRPIDFSDGLSNTAAMAERLVLRGENVDLPETELARQPRRYFWYTQRQVDGRGQEEEFVRVCETERTTQYPAYWHWNSQFLRGPSIGGYDHLLTPNSYGCLNGPYGNVALESSIAPANSLHDGGVNLLLADGHVRFVADGIDRKVWRAVGTRAGGEAENL